MIPLLPEDPGLTPAHDPAWNALQTAARREVQATLDALPEELRARAQSIPLAYERTPSPALIADGIEEDTLGLFVGGTYAENSGGEVPVPPQVILYLENIWDSCAPDWDAYREEIRTTLLHELGHYLGLDEQDLDDRGLA